MRQIAAEAEVDSALLYQHFDSKQDLFEAAIIEPIEHLFEELLTIGRGFVEATTDNKLDQLHAGVTALVHTMSEIAPLVAAALFNEQELGRRLYAARVAPLFDAAAGAVAVEVNSWGWRDADPDLLVPAAIAMSFGLAMDARFRGQSFDLVRASEEITNLLAYGIGLPPPRPPS